MLYTPRLDRTFGSIHQQALRGHIFITCECWYISWGCLLQVNKHQSLVISDNEVELLSCSNLRTKSVNRLTASHKIIVDIYLARLDAQVEALVWYQEWQLNLHYGLAGRAIEDLEVWLTLYAEEQLIFFD